MVRVASRPRHRPPAATFKTSSAPKWNAKTGQHGSITVKPKQTAAKTHGADVIVVALADRLRHLQLHPLAARGRRPLDRVGAGDALAVPRLPARRQLARAPLQVACIQEAPTEVRAADVHGCLLVCQYAQGWWTPQAPRRCAPAFSRPGPGATPPFPRPGAWVVGMWQGAPSRFRDNVVRERCRAAQRSGSDPG